MNCGQWISTAIAICLLGACSTKEETGVVARSDYEELRDLYRSSLQDTQNLEASSKLGRQQTLDSDRLIQAREALARRYQLELDTAWTMAVQPQSQLEPDVIIQQLTVLKTLTEGRLTLLDQEERMLNQGSAPAKGIVSPQTDPNAVIRTKLAVRSPGRHAGARSVRLLALRTELIKGFNDELFMIRETLGAPDWLTIEAIVEEDVEAELDPDMDVTPYCCEPF